MPSASSVTLMLRNATTELPGLFENSLFDTVMFVWVPAAPASRMPAVACPVNLLALTAVFDTGNWL